MSEKGDPTMAQLNGRKLVDRRTVLVSTSLGVAAAALVPSAAGAALTTQEQANRQAVRDMIDALAVADWDIFSSFLADDVRMWVRDARKPDETPSGSGGKEQIMGWMKEILGRIRDVELPMTSEQAIGSMVIHQRLESYNTDQGPSGTKVTAMYVVQNGKIAEWFEFLEALPE